MKYLVALTAYRDAGGVSQLDLLAQAIWSLRGGRMTVGDESGAYAIGSGIDGSGVTPLCAVAWIDTDLSVADLCNTIATIEAAIAGVDRDVDSVVGLRLIASDTQLVPDSLTVRRSLTAPVPETADVIVLPDPALHRTLEYLLPLAEISPQWRHPVLDQSVSQMLSALADPRKADASRIEVAAEGQRDVAE